MKKYFFLFFSFVLASCTTTYPLFSTGATSMTHYSFPQKAQFEELGPVHTSYCTSEAPAYGKEVGLLDELIQKSQRQTGADVIRNVRFVVKSSLGNSFCVELEGVAYQLKKKR